MFSNLLQTARGILNSVICVVYFSDNLNSVFHEKVPENYWSCSSIACQEKGTDWILRIFTFNNKNRLNLPIILKLQFFEGQSDQGVTQLVVKPFDISQTSRIVGLRKNMPGFSKPPFIFHLFF